MKTIEIECNGVGLVTDLYEASVTKLVLLSLIGRTSNRKKSHYQQLYSRIAKELNITSVIFDYSGHGDTPGNLDEIKPAQHIEESKTVFEWLATNYPDLPKVLVGSSYGGFIAATLASEYRIDAIIFRAPAIYESQDVDVARMNQSDNTYRLRRDPEMLDSHYLLANAKQDVPALVIAHEHDVQIPIQTTDAYAKAFNAELVTIKDIPHSLDGVDQNKISEYNQVIFDWLEEFVSKKL